MPLKFDPKPSEAAFSAIFQTSINADWNRDVISGMIVDPSGVKAYVNFGYSRSNRSGDVRLPHFVTNDDDAGRRTLCQ